MLDETNWSRKQLTLGSAETRCTSKWTKTFIGGFSPGKYAHLIVFSDHHLHAEMETSLQQSVVVEEEEGWQEECPPLTASLKMDSVSVWPPKVTNGNSGEI